MPEGVATGGQVVTGAVHDDPKRAPEPTADAPRGWTWNRGIRGWQPKIRGPVLFTPESDRPAESPGGDDPAGSPAAAPSGGGHRDPDPHYMRDDYDAKPAEGPSVPAFDEVPQEVKDDIASLGGLVATPVLALFRAVDPYCGAALADNFEGVFDATLPLICRSEKVIRYFTDPHSDWLMWGKLAMALAPVGRAIAEHHILHSVETIRDDKTGAVSVRRKTKDGQAADPLQPRFEPAAYAA